MKKTLLAITIAILVSTSLFATGSSEKGSSSSTSANAKQKEFTIFVNQNTVQPEFQNMYSFSKYEEISGVHINWINTPNAVIKEKVNLALASGDLPDAFLRCKISAQDLQTYGEAGDFVDLKPLLEEHAPNFVKYANEYPDVWASITTPNGQIFSIPAGAESPSTRISLKIFWNQEWLDKLGLEQPETIDELYTVLKAFKTQDPNGNGIADEVPIFTSTTNLYMVFSGLFNTWNHGSAHDNVLWDTDPKTGELRFFRTSDSWRACLEFMHKLYAEGIIGQECITYSDAKLVGLASQDQLGCYIMTNLSRLSDDIAAKYTPNKTAITGVDGTKLWTPIRSHLHSVGSFVITTECKNPAQLLEWVDYFYSDEGCLLYHYGTVGETCIKNADGSYSFTPEILAPMAEGKSYMEATGNITALGGGNNPTRMVYPYFSGLENSPVAMEAADALLPYTPEQVWPLFSYTPDELEVVNTIGKDIEKYVINQNAKFFTGEEAITDASWNAYKATVEKMGLAKYQASMNSAIDRALNLL